MKTPIFGTVEYEIEKSKSTGLSPTNRGVCGDPRKPRLLLHCCCGPCTAGTLAGIAEYFDITAYFYNPNIMPNEEFEKRLSALKEVLSHFKGVKLIVPEQSIDEYLSLVRGMENVPEGGERCVKCFGLRLENTAQYLAAHKDEYDYFTTTLTISPMKNASSINGIGGFLAHKYGVTYLNSDFKKRDGYLHSIQLCKEWNIYRQHYCGCALN
ncbi:MAG: epoxyqueuosine reductase QueH [Clostridia bacterium]|nr:epoxyqueuosine reductase QueH [Clostridia bacterium]